MHDHPRRRDADGKTEYCPAVDFRSITVVLAAAIAAGNCSKSTDKPDKEIAHNAPGDTPPLAPPTDRSKYRRTATPPDASQPSPDPKGEFDREARVLFRVAACSGNEPIPDRIGQKLVDDHCAAFAKLNDKYRDAWLNKASEFLRSLVPKDIPDRVIYPFGGEDLISALAVYPDAREITIFSLEPANDPRIVDRISRRDLRASLKRSRNHIKFLMKTAFHRTVDLKAMARKALPEQIVGALWALALHKRAPVTLRFFTLGDDGTLTYVTNSYRHFEITFRKPNGPLQTYRHIAGNIANDGLKKNPEIGRYIAARAPFAAMTKASSFLLWKAYFSTIRNLLLDNMVWMVSDATAPLPKHAQAAGFEQIPYGKFYGPEPAFGKLNHQSQFTRLWRTSPKRDCPIRWGYRDVRGFSHLLVTRKKK